MSTTETKTSYHERRREQGEVLIQTYVDAELRDRVHLIARKRGETFGVAVRDALLNYAFEQEIQEAEMIRSLFSPPEFPEAA